MPHNSEISASIDDCQVHHHFNWNSLDQDNGMNHVISHTARDNKYWYAWSNPIIPMSEVWVQVNITWILDIEKH